MVIISHRGYWKKVVEKNSVQAFQRSFSLGFGTETDIRDGGGGLVISHDIPSGSEISLEKFYEIYHEYSCNEPLALNIKADGLQERIAACLSKYGIENYFVFDMSVPDTLGYIKAGINVFVRCSEYESISEKLLPSAAGVWLDGFERLGLDLGFFDRLMKMEKKICIVSPELHGRDRSLEWEQIKSLPERITKSKNILLCTDVPEEAKEYFYG